MLVPQVLQQSDFPDGSDWESVSFSFHADFLQGDFVPCVDVNSFEDLSIRACTHNRLIAWFAVVYRL